MILIGQYDSSYVRRVGIALRLYRLPFEHRPWSVFGDADRLREINPLVRVPTLVLDDGEVLVESFSMIDHIDTLVEPERRMFSVEPTARRRAMKVATLATGLADKTVSLFYEKVLHTSPSTVWMERCEKQIMGVLSALEADRAGRRTDYWFGDAIGHADIAVAAALRHTGDSHPDLLARADIPSLQAFAGRLEAMPVFQEISQPFIPPA